MSATDQSGASARHDGILSLGTITGALNAIGTVWIFFLMVLINSDVVGRAAFNAPVLGVPEMVQFSIVGIVFLQLAHTLRIGALTRSDVLIGALLRRRPRVGHALQVVYHLTGAVLFALIFKTTWPLMIRAFQDGDFFGATGVFQLVIWPLKVIMLIGAAATGLQFLTLAWHDLLVTLGRIRPERPAAPAIME
jgi:TRAP-type mannitol/chloroaromatic compound transport system permease small subunit